MTGDSNAVIGKVTSVFADDTGYRFEIQLQPRIKEVIMAELRDYKCPLCCANKDENERLKQLLKDANSDLELVRKGLTKLNGETDDLKKEVEEWKAKYEDLRCETISRIRAIWEHAKKHATPGITTAQVFDPTYFTPGRLFKVERFRWNGDLVEEVNVVIIALSGENTRLECRSMDKDNACVTIRIQQVLNGKKDGVTLKPIKVVTDDES